MVRTYRKLRGGLTYANVAVTVAVVLGLTGLAVAAVPESSKVIQGCVRKHQGTLRVVSGTKCSKSEKTISWNESGPQEPQGVPGTPGATGQQGV